MIRKKTNFSGVTIDSFLLTFVKLITTLLSLISIRIISGGFSLNEYGMYSQALLIVSTFTSFSILGLSDASNYYYNKNYNDLNEKQKYMSSIFAIQYVVGIVAALIILFGNKFLTNYFQSESLKDLYLIIAFMPLLNNLLSMLQVLYISAGKSKIIAVRNLLISTCRLIIFAISVYIFKSIEIILILTLLLDVSQFIYFYSGFRRFGVKFRFRKIEMNIIISILRYSLPIAGYIILNNLMRDLDKLTITYFMETSDLALYANLSRILPFDLFSVSMATILLPFITAAASNKDKKKLQFIYGKYLNLNLFITMILVSGALLFSQELILILYGNKFLIGQSIFIIYLLVDLVRFANISLIFSASGRTKILLYNAIVSLIANIVLNICFYYIFGMVGPAIATLIVTLSSNIFFLFNTSKLMGQTAFKLFDFKRVLLIISQITFLGIFFYLFNNVIKVQGIHYFIRFFIGYGIFCTILLLLNKKILIQLLKDINGLKKDVN